ncbi:MAG: hypothetical protein ABIK61_02605 [candidate division WOR-3 bacterium]
MSNFRCERGIILLELLFVIMIMGLLIAGAVKTWDVTIQQTRFNQTVKELDELSMAIVGNPNLYTEGKRTDFGYVGDMGSLPDSLADLVRAPSGAISWRGPYVKVKFNEDFEDYLKDAWGDYYIYSRESLYIRSYGGGTILTPNTWITKRFARDSISLIRNIVQGRVTDLLNNPPGAGIDTLFLTVGIIYPVNNGTSMATQIRHPNAQGNYILTDIPQGNHLMFCLYDTTPSLPDTTDYVEKYGCIYPGVINEVNFRLTVGF